MGKAIGIDLGTTNSVAAFKQAEIQVFPVEGNSSTSEHKLMRSVVSCEDGKILTGNRAYQSFKQFPKDTIISIKRLMGRGFSDEAVQKQHSHYAYKITTPQQCTDNSLAV